MTRFNREDSRTVLPQLSELVDKLYKKLGKTYILDSYETTNINFTSLEYKALTVTIATRNGYTPIVVACNCYSHSAPRVFNYYINGSTLTYEVVNTSSSSITNAKFSITILNLKTELSKEI